jgi:hypothetical protein
MKNLEVEFHPLYAEEGLATLLGNFHSFSAYVAEEEWNPERQIAAQKKLISPFLGGADAAEWGEEVLAHGRANCMWRGGELVGATPNTVCLESEGGVRVKITRIQWNGRCSARVHINFGRDSRCLAGEILRQAASGARRTL